MSLESNRHHLGLVEETSRFALCPVRDFYVYVLTNTANVLYIGVTSDLAGRLWEHVEERSSQFSAKYNLDKLIYFETYPTAREAIAREKQLKGWRREKKIALIDSMNPAWKDLSGRFRE
jgi:putative endonuclease